MSAKDLIERSNSLHWLCAVTLVSAIVSVVLPTYGWSDVLRWRKSVPQKKVQAARERLAELEALSPETARAADEKTKKVRKDLADTRAKFAAWGIEEVPESEEAVFTAQGRVGEALAKRRISILSTGASVAKKEIAPKETAVKKEKKALSAAEFRARTEAAAAKIKDRNMREALLADARKTAAKMEEEERKNAPAKGSANTQVPGGDAPFKTEEIAVKASGDFRDIFLFLVGETHKKPYYAYKDIAVRRAENGDTEFSFVLEVNRK